MNDKSPHNADKVPLVLNTTFSPEGQSAWYHPVLVGPSTLGNLALQNETLINALKALEKLEPDDYSRYLSAYYHKGLSAAGSSWRYADIITALYAAARIIQPKLYLEIGVRRGRSMAMVASQCPDCHLLGFDMWIENYAGMKNPGTEFVQNEIKKTGHRGTLELISGNSHETLKQYFDQHPGTAVDLLTIDGDHTEEGSIRDFEDTLPRLKIGGAVIFDDIAHPRHPYLGEVWEQYVKKDSRFASWEFSELGYGVGIGVRKEP